MIIHLKILWVYKILVDACYISVFYIVIFYLSVSMTSFALDFKLSILNK